MKKTGVLVLALVLLLSLPGCIMSDSEPTELPPDDDFSLIEYSVVDEEELTEEAREMLDLERLAEGSHLFLDGYAPFLAVFSGERNTGGYGIEVASVSLDGKTLMVSVVLIEPDPEAVLTQALTYPMQVVELTGISDIDGIEVELEIEETRIDHLD